MGRARSRSLSTRSYASLLALFAAREASASEVAILPSAEGRFGAWLAAGPVVMAKAKAPSPIDTAILSGGEDATLSGRLGRPISFVSQGPEAAPAPGPAWRLVSSTQGPIDLAASFNQRGAESFAFLYGVLHLTEPLKGMLLVGASDGVRIYVDRKLVSSSDYPRPERDDEEIIRLDLPAGDHPILMKLHHRDGYWAVRTRVVDETFRAPKGASLRLPGTGDTDARALAAKMTDVDVDRGLSPRGFRPTVRVAFHEGLPRGADRAVHVAVDIRSGGGKPNRVFTVFGGEVPLGESGPSQLNVELPQLTSDDMGDAENGGELAFSIDAGARKVEAVSTLRPFMRQAMVAAADALAALTPDSKAFLADTEITRATVLHLRDRFERYVNAGDGDLEALQADAQTIGEFAADLKARRDPLRRHAGIRRFAYRAPFDGELSPFGVYVPESYANGSAPRDKTYPLVVALHGMNGKPLSMARIFFGHDDEAHDAEWEDRHPGEVDPVDGFVIAPNAYGNAMYRELGEADVINVLDLAEHLFPIDKNRVTITGVSMGGTGAASIALRYPDRFAAAEPLCGYHSYFVRRDLMGRGMWPWEKLLSEQRSNSLWAENGLYLPLYVWHGKKDLPEKNSGVLIERYQALGFPIEHEHPDVGHDVWRRAYDGNEGFRWLSQKTRPAHKQRVTFKTDSPRYADHAWVHLREIASDLAFASIDANVTSPTEIDVKTERVIAFGLDRDPELLASKVAVRLKVDGTTLTFGPDAPIEAHREGDAWAAGPKGELDGHKRRGLSGPIRDAFFEPLVFVYGTGDPKATQANREVAHAWARIRWGVDARFPIIADAEFDDALAETHSLVLVGNAEQNRVVRALEPHLPFRATQSAIVATNDQGPVHEWKGADLGVAFIYPNPEHASRYVLVIEGTSPLGTFRAIALPELLPDFMVYGDKIAAARGQILLGNATPLAAGLFNTDWSLGRLNLPQR